MEDRITLENRAIEAPEFDTVDFDETFTAPNPPAWALVETVRGKTFFDGVSTEEDLTHWIYINFDASVTAETWVKLEDGRRLDILRVENLDERSVYQLLHCNDRGDKEASKA
jgi:head-tail adaptor